MSTMQPFGRENGGHPNYKRNLNATVDREPSCACAYCGRYTGQGTLFVFLTNVGDFDRYEDHPDNMDHLGLYPVGAGCARLLKMDGISIYDWEGNPK